MTLIGKLLCAALLAAIAVALIGRAIDHEVSERVLFTRSDGVTLDCKRVVKGHGNVYYTGCVRVP